MEHRIRLLTGIGEWGQELGPTDGVQLSASRNDISSPSLCNVPLLGKHIYIYVHMYICIYIYISLSLSLNLLLVVGGEGVLFGRRDTYSCLCCCDSSCQPCHSFPLVSKLGWPNSFQQGNLEFFQFPI